MRRYGLALMALVVGATACDQPLPEETHEALRPLGRPPHPLLPPSNISTISTISTIITIDSSGCTCGSLADCEGPPYNDYWTCNCSCVVHACPAGRSNCDGNSASVPQCESYLSDSANCGTACVNCNATGKTCVAPTTGTSYVCCAAGQINCAGACADPSANTTCGACTNCTTSGLVCATNGGSHICCASGQINCGGACAAPTADTTCGASCTDCTASGKKCASSGGSHICCPAGQINCGGACVDPTLDGNCGGCGVTCTTGQTPKLKCCNMACADVTQNGNCGACGVTCAAGTACSPYGNSAMCCSTTTSPAQIYCGSACVSPNSSANCGGCTPCGGATPNCCGSTCYDTTTNSSNCGGCAMPCSTTNIDTLQPVCTGGNCTGTCKAGFADCAGTKRSTGCQTNLNTDTSNCGGCGHACPTTQFGTAMCSGGMCSIVCDGQHKLCGGACVPVTSCCTSDECTTPPDECHAVRGVCAAGQCSYAQIVCPDLDCQDHAGCKAGVCQYSAKPAGTLCGATGCYTARDGGAPTCQLDSNNNVFCDGAPKDCKAFDTQCTIGTCDAKDGSCKGLPSNSGAACTPADKCQVDGTCQAGACQATPKVCPAPRACHVMACDPATGDCADNQLSPSGTACDSDNPCLISTACDDQGSCSGTLAPDGTACVFSGSCDSTASCYSGQCLCDSTVDMAVSITNPSPRADMGTAPKKSPSSCKCDVGGAPAGDGAAWLLGGALLLVSAARRRRRSAPSL